MDRKATLAALEIVKPALATRSSTQELSYVWFDSGEVFAHNGGLGIRTKLSGPLLCGVPGALLHGLLTQTGTENIDFDATGDLLSWKAGKSKVKLATLPVDRKVWRYPLETEGDPVAAIKLTKDFLAALKSVMALKISKPETMIHYSVCVFAAGKETEAYVSDGKSMMILSVASTVLKGAKKLAVPRELAEQLVAQCEEGRELKMYATHYEVRATDNTTLYCNVFDTSEMLDMPAAADKYVDTKRNPPIALPEGFTATLEKAVLLAGLDEPLVKLSVAGTKMKVSAKFKAGTIDEEYDLDSAGKKSMTNVNAKLLLGFKGVTDISVSDNALVLFGGDDYTFVITSKGEDSGGDDEEDGEADGE